MKIIFFKKNDINKRMLDLELDMKLVKKDMEDCKFILESIRTDIKILMERK